MRTLKLMALFLVVNSFCAGLEIHVPADYPTIQAAIDAATDGCEIIVSPGEYKENINFKGKNIILCSTDPSNASVVGRTIINGKEAGSVITFSGTETALCVLDGFTLISGYAEYGAGINGNGCFALIQDNVIRNNKANSFSGVIYRCTGIIQKNIISGNTGAGLCNCDGTIQNNMVSGNTGTGVIYCNGKIQNNTISGNAGISAGGLYHCSGTIQNNIIS